MLKMDYFGSKSQKSPSAGAQPTNQTLEIDLMTKAYSKTLLPLNILVDADAWQFWVKTNLYFIFSASSLSKKLSRATE